MIAAVARSIGASGLGSLLVAVTIVTAAGNAARLGAATGIVRWLPEYLENGRGRRAGAMVWIALSPTVVAGSLVALLLFLGSDRIGSVLVNNGTSNAAEYIRWLAPTVPAAAATFVILVVARGLGAVGPYVVLETVVRPILQCAATVAVCLWHPTPAGLAVAWAAPFGVEAVLALVWVRRIWNVAVSDTAEVTPVSSRQVARDYWRFTSPQAGADVFLAITQRLDILFMAAFASASAAAIYGGALRYFSAGGTLLSAAIIVVGPPISRAFARRQIGTVSQLYRRTTATIATIGLPLYLALGIFSTAAMRVFGHEFGSGGTALSIMSAGMILSITAGPVSTVLALGGASKTSSAWTIGAAGLGVTCDILLIPPFGLVGGAVALAAATAVANLGPLRSLYRRFAIHPFGSDLRNILTMSVCVLALPWLAVLLVVGDATGWCLLAISLGVAVFAFLVRRYRAEAWTAEDEAIEPISVGARSPV
jgi:O-antigen/teichoic acid export membrane protein